MNKFKIGDKVRYVGSPYPKYHTGALDPLVVYTIASARRFNGGINAVSLKDGPKPTDYTYDYHNFELVVEAAATPKPHKHAALIKAWADGAKIQFTHGGNIWHDCNPTPGWKEDSLYRVKPEPKPDIVWLGWMGSSPSHTHWQQFSDAGNGDANVRATYDGETGKLKSVEKI